ncbi:MAG: putative lipid II flippase FtsW [Chloroflexi bacterium]|nr:putative lipid II flippase FtsW [Chloroflexota bacterium]
MRRPAGENPEADVVVGKPDYLLLGATIALLLLGTIMVYSASFVVAHNEFNDDAYFLVRQLMWVVIGVGAMFLGYRIDYHGWRRFSLPIMLLCLLLLLAVLVPGVGTRSYGAVRWIRVGPLLQVQPSELAKIAIVLYLADWLARRERLVGNLGKGLIPFAIIVGTLAWLVEMQPDLGTVSIIVGTAACVFFVAGANLLHVGALGAGGVLAGLTLVSHLSGYRQDRITAFLDPWSDIQGSGWHTAQGLIALGSGGPFGVGLGDSHQKFYWVPNAHTDAIFAIIGEELGFLGALGVLALFTVLTWRGFLHAWRAPDAFGRLFGTGLTCLLGLQALINIAVVTNSVPYTGVTLPLVSFGGSSTVISMLAVGLLLNLSRYQRRALPGAPARPEPATSWTPRLARWHVERVVSHHRRSPSPLHPNAATRRPDTATRSVRRLYRSRRAFEARDD